jgi:protein TonB
MSYKAEKSFWEKFSGVFFVVIFHLAVIYGLAVGLNHDPMDLLRQQVDAKIIEEVAPPPEEAPPPPPPDFVPPPPDFVPPPDIEFAADEAPPPAANAITVSRAPPPPVVAAVVGARTPKKGLSRPPYPSSSVRLGEEGLVGLSLYLDTNGKVRDGKVAISSGFERLDTAALKHAMREWKFDPCLEGSQPVACWHKINFRFAIKDAGG